MERIFYPIGQGAYYVEKHEGFNIVYDCGFWRSRGKHAANVVKNSFTKNDVIDILFISHFDYDHISCIPLLKKTARHIKYVVYPYMEPIDKAFLLIADPRISSGELRNLVMNTGTYFGDDTKSISVLPNNEPVSDNIILLDRAFQNDRIQSGNPLSLDYPLEGKWIFIPYNVQRLIYTALVNQGLNAAGIFINEKNIDALLANKTTRNAIKSIYVSLPGGINNHSMLLYSGPDKMSDSYIQYILYNSMAIYNHTNLKVFYGLKKSACLYTGDMNMNLIDVKTIFNNYFDKIGTIQISHHGDRKTFNDKLFSKTGYLCPISFSTTNNYGHPDANVASCLMKQGSVPMYITESDRTKLVQVIR